MDAVILARLTAPSSVLPICPTVKILATGKLYCSKKVRMSGAELFVKTFASRCQLVLIFPAATASFHFLLIVFGESRPPYGWLGSPSDTPSSVVRSEGD